MKLSNANLSQTLWLLDYDGSLCPHVEIWEERQYDAAEIYESISYLNKKTQGALWNTGRRKDSLEGVHSALLDFSGYFVQGSFHWNSSSSEYQRLGPLLPAAIRDHYQMLLKGHEKFRLEVKETSIRIAPKELQQLDSLKRWIAENPLELQVDHWAWVTGHRGVELLATGFNKGSAVRRERELRGNTFLPVVVGDDVLDETAAREALVLGGYVVLVGDSCGWITTLPHQAWQIQYFEEPSDLLNWIRTL